MDSPPHSQQIPSDENEQLTPKKQLTPVQNAVTLRLKKLMSERKIQYNMDTSKEIDLNDENTEPEVKISPDRQQRDDSLREWFRKRTPKASPANKKKQLKILKEELLERMKAQRHEEQESRQRVFKADNEIYDEEEEFNESENESDADNEESGSEGDIEDEEIPESQKVDFDDEENIKDEEESVDNHSLDSTSNDENTNDIEEESNQSDQSDQTDQSNKFSTLAPNEDQSNFAFTDKTSNSYNLSPFMQDNDHTDQPINKPTNFANLHLDINPIHHTTSISLHKTCSTPRIGSGYLLNEVPDSQSLDSQTLANEMRHLIEEQQQNAITERDNYDMLLNLTKFKADAKKEESSESISSKEEDDADVFKKAAKRKLQIESDNESDNESEKLLPATPSSGVTKLAKLNDDLFQIDDGDDRVDMEQVKPFVETVRVLFDDEDEEVNEPPTKTTNQQVEEEVVEDEEFDEDLDESMALQRAKAKWFQDEAELSGSDVDSDDEQGEDQQDEYEHMEGDDDDLPEEEIRDGIIKTHMKLQNIDEERRLNQLKELFDNELNPGNNWDRSFRSRVDEDNFDVRALLGDPLDANDTQSDPEEDEIMTFKDHLEKQAAEASESKELSMFTLASFADELTENEIEDSAPSKKKTPFKHNPNGIAKFIVENFYFRKDDSSSNP